MKEIQSPNDIEIRNSTTTCHWLPCSIDYDGFAPIHMHFRPELHTIPQPEIKNEITSSHHNDNGNDGDDDNDDSTTQTTTTPTQLTKNIQAVSFRGRGLLANDNDHNTTSIPKNIIGSVMIPTRTKNNGEEGTSYGTIVTKEVFDKVLQWEHESYEQNLLNVERGLECNDVRTPGSVGKSTAMFEVLRSVHDLIPVSCDD